MSDLARVARRLWLDARPGVLAQADELSAAARAWDEDGRPEAWAIVASRSHQLAGSLGSFAAALRADPEADSDSDPDSDVEAAAAAALELDRAVHEEPPDAALVVVRSEALRTALSTL